MLIQVQLLDKKTGAIVQQFSVVEYVNDQATGTQINTSTGMINIDVPANTSNTYYIFSSVGYDILTVSAAALLSEGVDNVSYYVNPTGSKTSGLLVAGAGAIALLMLAGNSKKHKVGKLQSEDVMPYVLIGGALLAFGAIKGVGEKLGIFSSADSDAIKAAIADPNSFWKPAFYKKYSSFPHGNLDTSTANNLITTIKNSMGFFSPDVPAIDGAFNTLTSKSQVSQLADYFMQSNGEDLLSYLVGFSWLETRLSDAEANQINQTMSNLPNN